MLSQPSRTAASGAHVTPSGDDHDAVRVALGQGGRERCLWLSARRQHEGVPARPPQCGDQPCPHQRRLPGPRSPEHHEQGLLLEAAQALVDLRLAPDITSLNDSAPVQPGKDGLYEIPVPGKAKAF